MPGGGSGPTSCAEGVIIDANTFELRLPAEKLQRLQTLIQSWCSTKAHTRKELCWGICPMLLPLFVRVALSYANCLAYSTGSMYPTTLCALMQGQEQIWPGGNVSSRPGMVLRFFHCMTPPSIYTYSDASGGFGYGAFVEGLGWFRGQWPQDWMNIDISQRASPSCDSSCLVR